MRVATAILILLLCATAFAQEHKVLIHQAALVAYPDVARRARIQGDAHVMLRLRSDGSAEIVDLKGHPMFENAVREAIPGFRFVCANCFGDANVQFGIVVHFDLTELDMCTDGGWRNRIGSPTQIDVLAGSVICENISQSFTRLYPPNRLD